MPFRKPDLIDFLIKKLDKNCNLIQTVKKINNSTQKFFSMNSNGKLNPLLNSDIEQEKPISEKIYYRSYGLFTGTNFKASGKTYNHVINDPKSLIDIDDICDLDIAEKAMKIRSIL